jgi:hypothetical protein
MKKRNFTRVDFTECASFKHEGQVFFGDIKNMSLNGMFIKTSQELPLHAAVEVTIYHSPQTAFRMQAKVVRSEESGLGIQIDSMNVASFTHIRDIVAMQCNDLDLIMRETYKMVGCIH